MGLPETVILARQDIREVLSDTVAFISTLWGECRGESIEGQIAVACIIRNRANANKVSIRPWKDVCLDKWQFSCWWGNDANSQATYDYAKKALQAEDPLTRQLRWIVVGIVAGSVIDLTHGASHYITTKLYQTDPPTWAKAMQPLATIGAHTFLSA